MLRNKSYCRELDRAADCTLTSGHWPRIMNISFSNLILKEIYLFSCLFNYLDVSAECLPPKQKEVKQRKCRRLKSIMSSFFTSGYTAKALVSNDTSVKIPKLDRSNDST